MRQAGNREHRTLPALALRPMTVRALGSENALALSNVFASSLRLRARFCSLARNEPANKQKAGNYFQATCHLCCDDNTLIYFDSTLGATSRTGHDRLR